MRYISERQAFFVLIWPLVFWCEWVWVFFWSFLCSCVLVVVGSVIKWSKLSLFNFVDVFACLFVVINYVIRPDLSAIWLHTYIHSHLFPLGVGRNYKMLRCLHTPLASSTFIHLIIHARQLRDLDMFQQYNCVIPTSFIARISSDVGFCVHSNRFKT